MAKRSERPGAMSVFRSRIWKYFRSARRDFPWRRTNDPYAILVSEVMLQQTQTDRVVPKYDAWLRRFPSFKALAGATRSEVLEAWQGLGYNRRAVSLHEAARIVVREYDCVLPQSSAELMELPGIGAYTAGAILAFAFGEPGAFIETNIRRAFIYAFFPKKRMVHDRDILPLIAASVPPRRVREWYYAVMDYGAMLGRTLRKENPNRKSSTYARQSRFEGSRRQLRGKLLATLLRERTARVSKLAKAVGQDAAAVRDVLQVMEREGFIRIVDGCVTVSK